jgi:outer membrane murein-binding lipoprotein Lpp
MQRPFALAALLLLPLLAAGCSSSARRQLADSRQRIETLQAQSDQLRNEALTLRNRNRDLARRAVDDARKLRDLELTNGRLEQAIVSYQDERRKVADAFQNLQDQVHRQAMADDPTPHAQLDPEPARPRPMLASASSGNPAPPSSPAGNTARFAAFARAQPGTRFDPDRAAWTVPSETLFQPDSAHLNARAPLLLDAFARLAATSDDPVTPARIVFSAPEVRQAGHDEDGGAPSLDADRAQALRRELAARLDVPIDTITLAPNPGSSPSCFAIELQSRR